MRPTGNGFGGPWTSACPGWMTVRRSQTRVLARARGERRGPRRLSLALAVALLVTLLAAAALAAGVLTGWLRVRQEDVGALHGCVSLDGTLYLSTSGGLRTWKPGQEEPELLVSMDELQAQGIGFDTLIYADGDAPALLDLSGKKLWRWQDGALVCTLDYAGTPMDLPQRRVPGGGDAGRLAVPACRAAEGRCMRRTCTGPIPDGRGGAPAAGGRHGAVRLGRRAAGCRLRRGRRRMPPYVGGPGERRGPYPGRAVHAGNRGRGLRRGYDLRHRGGHAVPVERHGLDGAAGLRARPSGLRLCGGGRGLRLPWHERHQYVPFTEAGSLPRSPSAVISARTTSTRIFSRPAPAWPYRAPPTPRSRRGRWPRPSPPGMKPTCSMCAWTGSWSR